MTPADVILTTAFSPMPASVLALFQRPTRVVTLPVPPGQGYQAMVAGYGSQPVRGILQQYAPDVTPLRVAAMGFSESCQFPRAILRSADGGRLDAAVAIDGIHAQWSGNGSHSIAPGYLEAWEGFASLAASGGPLLAITTSSIVPAFVSTTETSDAIWRAVTGSDDDREDTSPDPTLYNADLNPPVTIHSQAGGTTTYTSLPTKRYRNAGSLYIYNYGDLDAPGTNDHILQAQVILPRVLAAYLAARWNGSDPSQGAFPDGYMQGAPDQPVPGVSIVPGGSAPPNVASPTSLLGRAIEFVKQNPVAVFGAALTVAVGIGIAAGSGGRR